jgi:hypothetical protein
VINLKNLYHNWRKYSLFPSINDIEWRHTELAARLDQIYNLITKDKMVLLGTSQDTQKKIIEFLSHLQPMKILNDHKIRVGSLGDGGYVQLNNTEDISLALSFGINNDDSWDLEIASRGIPVKQYDYSIESAPSSHPLLKFEKKMVQGSPGFGCVTLQELIETHDYSGTPNIILKMDIEGSEWDVIDKCDDEQLSKICQILCEFHDLSRLNDVGFYTRALRVVQKLNKHFTPYHVHGNNSAQLVNLSNIAFPDVLEVSFANTKMYKITNTNEIFPTSLDNPNNPEFPDIFLGNFAFKEN